MMREEREAQEPGFILFHSIPCHSTPLHSAQRSALLGCQIIFLFEIATELTVGGELASH